MKKAAILVWAATGALLVAGPLASAEEWISSDEPPVAPDGDCFPFPYELCPLDYVVHAILGLVNGLLGPVRDAVEEAVRELCDNNPIPILQCY